MPDIDQPGLLVHPILGPFNASTAVPNPLKFPGGIEYLE
jgi:hypothetical protein